MDPEEPRDAGDRGVVFLPPVPSRTGEVEQRGAMPLSQRLIVSRGIRQAALIAGTALAVEALRTLIERAGRVPATPEREAAPLDLLSVEHWEIRVSRWTARE